MQFEKQGEYNGYQYYIVAQPAGHRCGYVNIPEGHYLYNKNYQDKLDISVDVLEGQKMGKRGVIDLFCWNGEDVNMGILFDVHGGITYSEDCLGDLKGWFIGFDCAHYYDAKDFSIMDEKYKEIEMRFQSRGIVRTREYVEQECHNLINQIIKYESYGEAIPEAKTL
jgi:hypothetical protein